MRNVGKRELALDLSWGLVWVFASFLEKEGVRKGGLGVYLRFLNTCIPSIVVMYWNPFSMSLVASLAVVAPVHVHSSSFRLSRCI